MRWQQLCWVLVMSLSCRDINCLTNKTCPGHSRVRTFESHRDVPYLNLDGPRILSPASGDVHEAAQALLEGGGGLTLPACRPQRAPRSNVESARHTPDWCLKLLIHVAFVWENIRINDYNEIRRLSSGDKTALQANPRVIRWLLPEVLNRCKLLCRLNI